VALRFPFGAVPRPDNWSGYRVIPEVVEFWHQRPFRHHDRQRFRLEGGEWRHEWLFP
jgi:pyridoxamine 5'-phosphate oxidase